MYGNQKALATDYTAPTRLHFFYFVIFKFNKYMCKSVKNVSTMNNSNCTNTLCSATTANRNKLHKVTELTEQDVLVLAQFSITPEKELELLKKANRKAMQFLSEKGLLEDFHHFINQKSA